MSELHLHMSKDMSLLPGEPVFVLRAKDMAAVRALSAYRDACEEEGSPRAHVEGVNEVIRTFREWRVDHWSDVKIPD